MRIVFTELQGRSVFREGIQIHGKKIHGEFTVDVVKFKLVFFVFGQFFRINRFEIVLIVGAVVIDAFMDDKEFAVFDRRKDMPAIRAFEFERFDNLFTSDKCLAADFALKLTVAAIVIVKIVMSRPTKRTNNCIRNRFSIAPLNWLQIFLVLPFVVSEQKLPVLFEEWFNDRQLIRFEFLISG
jgi:hypothetical protein